MQTAMLEPCIFGLRDEYLELACWIAFNSATMLFVARGTVAKDFGLIATRHMAVTGNRFAQL
jgi:hypothetical protein